MSRGLTPALLVTAVMLLSSQGAGGAAGSPPTDPMAAQQQPLKIMHVGEAVSALGRALRPVRVMVVDTGLDLQHPDFENILFSLPSPVPAPDAGAGGGTVAAGAHGWDMIGDACNPPAEKPDPNPDDPVACSGHGTLVAGVLGGQWNNGQGGAGVAPNARFIAMRTCWDGDQCYGHIVPPAIKWGADRGARVITFSWLAEPPNADLVREMRNARRTLFVTIPSGNGGAFDADPTNPFPCDVNLPNVLCVSTSSPDGGLDCGAYGPQSVDVAVPTRNSVTTKQDGTFVRTGCATSFASPTAGGVATILFGLFQAATPAQVKQAIIAGAARTPQWRGKSVSGGIIDALGAVRALQRIRGGGGGTTCAGVTATRVGSSGNDVVNGTDGRDVIVSLGGADRINSAGGSDLICAGEGRDVVDAGLGADQVRGGAGPDRLNGEDGNDLIFGETGNDSIDGGAGRDICHGGAGRDASINCQIQSGIP